MCLAACWTGAAPEPTPVPAAKPKAIGPTVETLTPKGLEGVWLSMPVERMTTARPKATQVSHGERRELYEYKPAKGIEQVRYYFGPKEPHLLYEIRAVYEDKAHALFALDDRFTTRGLVTPPVREDLSFLVTIKTTKFDVGAWVDETTLIIAASLEFTERFEHAFPDPPD